MKLSHSTPTCLWLRKWGDVIPGTSSLPLTRVTSSPQAEGCRCWQQDAIHRNWKAKCQGDTGRADSDTVSEDCVRDGISNALKECTVNWQRRIEFPSTCKEKSVSVNMVTGKWEGDNKDPGQGLFHVVCYLRRKAPFYPRIFVFTGINRSLYTDLIKLPLKK